MAIYTRFGSKVLSVRDYDETIGNITAKIQRDSLGGEARVVERRVHVSELRADGGINEILEVAEAYSEHPGLVP